MQLAVGLLAALLASGGSQIVLVPRAPDGSATEVAYTWADGRATLGRPGYALYVDKLIDVVYRIEEEDAERMFGTVLERLHETRAQGLPELPHSYAVLLAPEKGDAGHLDIQVGEAAPVRLDRAGHGYLIDGYPNGPQTVDSERLRRDFADALDAEAATLKAMDAYLALLAHPSGHRDRLTYHHDGRRHELTQPGQALALDGSERILRPEDIAHDFAESLAAEDSILAAGLPELRHSRAVLLAHVDGPLGTLEFTPDGAALPLQLRHAGDSAAIDGYPEAPRTIDPAQLAREFTPALTALAETRKTLSSYALVLADSAGDAPQLVYRHRAGVSTLTQPGDGLTLADGLDHTPDPARVTRDFEAALDAERAILAEGLPELAHSRIQLLAHPKGPLGELRFEPSGPGPSHALTAADSEVFIDGYPDVPRAAATDVRQRDFGASLEALASAYRALRSYLVLMPDADGPSPRLEYRADAGIRALDQPGTSLTLADGLDHEPDADQFSADFSPALAAQSDLLAAGLPELAHSRIVLLSHDLGPLGEIGFTADATHTAQRLLEAGQEVFIDGYPDMPHGADVARLRQDFAPTLVSLAQALKSLRSYIVLLESPDGAASKVIYRTAKDARLLEHPGESMTLDGFDYDPDAVLSGRDFGAARTSTRQILDEGLPRLPHSYVALVRHQAGPLGEVAILAGIAAGVVLDQENESVLIDGYSNKTYRLEADQYRADFGAAIDAFPPPPVSLYLYFEPGSTRIAKESLAALDTLFDAIRQHPAADISIAGHTDTVGAAALNDRLSLQRGESVAALIRRSGLTVQAIEVAAYGKSSLAIETPDNTPELLNRRVEVTVR